MYSKSEENYNLDDHLSEILADAGENEDEGKNLFLKSSTVEKLSTENARLEDDTTKVLPESPWYLVIVMVVAVGVIAGGLFLMG